MAGDADVDQFLWELEQALSHVDGEHRLELVREAEAALHREAEAIAEAQGDEELDWYHYVQATAELGPPERLAAELTGQPLPDREASHRKLLLAAGSLGAVVLLVLVLAVLGHGELVDVGNWSGQEAGVTEQRVLEMNISPEAESVFLTLFVAPTAANSSAHVTVLDGQANLVYQASATPGDRIDVTRFLEGEPGTWRVLLDLRSFTGTWKVDGRQELP